MDISIFIVKINNNVSHRLKKRKLDEWNVEVYVAILAPCFVVNRSIRLIGTSLLVSTVSYTIFMMNMMWGYSKNLKEMKWSHDGWFGDKGGGGWF